jgi:hypothetical protein
MAVHRAPWISPGAHFSFQEFAMPKRRLPEHTLRFLACSILAVPMKRLLAGSLLPFLLLAALFAVEQPYQAGKILDVVQKVNTEVLYYIVNTPVTKDHPYYEVSVQVKNIVYVGQYAPRHSADTLPLGWNVGAGVQARIEDRTIFLRRPEGQELPLAIVKHSPAKSQPTNSP